MGILDKFFKKKKSAEVKTEAPRPKKKSEKELATERGEPYVTILSMEIDPENMQSGAFELDWNDKFVAKLVRAGYKGKTDHQIVDQWFQEICRNVISEAYEQEQADPEQRTATRRKIDDNRTEFS
jgi:hypothetical protein